jgi:CRISPR type III-A-associated protein Csm2
MPAYEITDMQPIWVTDGIQDRSAVDWAQEFGNYLGDDFLWDNYEQPMRDARGNSIKSKLTTTKLRNFFGEVKRIQIRLAFDGGFDSEKVNILMLKPKLAYHVGREEGQNRVKVKMFYQQLSRGIDVIDMTDPVKGKKHFENFVKLMEAVVAYHKAKEGGL